MREFPFYLAGEPCRSAHQLEVLNPCDRSPAGRTWVVGDREFEQAAQAAVAAAEPMRRLPAFQRANILRAASAEIESRREESGDTLAREAGKPIRDALVETDRAAIQAGVFTSNLEHSLRAFEELEVGGVIIDDVPTWRIDHAVRRRQGFRAGPRRTAVHD